MNDPIGDVTRPRYICLNCGRVAYCELHKPPEKTLAHFRKQHRVVCGGKIEYRAGIQPASRIVGQGGK